MTLLWKKIELPVSVVLMIHLSSKLCSPWHNWLTSLLMCLKGRHRGTVPTSNLVLKTFHLISWELLPNVWTDISLWAELRAGEVAARAVGGWGRKPPIHVPPAVSLRAPQKSSNLVSVLFLLFLFSPSVVSNSATPWTVAHQAPLSRELPRQECWSGLPFPSPGIEPASLESPTLTGGFFSIEPPGKPWLLDYLLPPEFHSLKPLLNPVNCNS